MANLAQIMHRPVVAKTDSKLTLDEMYETESDRMARLVYEAYRNLRASDLESAPTCDWHKLPDGLVRKWTQVVEATMQVDGE